MAKMKLEDVKAELDQLGVKYDAKADYKTLTSLLADNINAEEVEAPEDAEEIEEEVLDTENADGEETEDVDVDVDETENVEEVEEDPKNLKEALNKKVENRLKEISELKAKAVKTRKNINKEVLETAKAVETGKAIKVVVESTFYDENDRIFRHGASYDVTSKFFSKYEDKFVKNDKEGEVKLSDKPL